MNLKITAVLGFLLVGLLGFVLFYERPRMAEEKRAIEAEKTFIDVERHLVARLTLVNGDHRIVAEKRGNDWRVVEPVETAGDWEELEGMIEVAKVVERGRVVVDENAFAETDLADFGLDPPQIELQFEPRDGVSIRLLFGDDIPSKRGCYLTWSGSKKVVLTKREYRNRFNRTLFDVRDKRMFPFDPDLVTAAHFVTPVDTFEVVRHGLNWEITHPIRERADAGEVLRLLGLLKAERITEVFAERVDDPATYGFDKPGYKVVLHRGNDSDPWTLLLGKRVPDETLKLWYAHVLDRPQVVIVEPFITEFLDVPFDAMRYKQVFEFDRNGIDRVQLVYPDSIVECKKQADASWQVLSPEDKRVDQKTMGDFIDRTHNLVVAGFEGPKENLGAYGLDAPKLTVSLWRGDKRVREIVVGQGKDDLWYGMVPERNEIYLLPYQVMSWFELKLDSGSAEDREGA